MESLDTCKAARPSLIGTEPAHNLDSLHAAIYASGVYDFRTLIFGARPPASQRG